MILTQNGWVWMRSCREFWKRAEKKSISLSKVHFLDLHNAASDHSNCFWELCGRDTYLAVFNILWPMSKTIESGIDNHENFLLATMTTCNNSTFSEMQNFKHIQSLQLMIIYVSRWFCRNMAGLRCVVLENSEKESQKLCICCQNQIFRISVTRLPITLIVSGSCADAILT